MILFCDTETFSDVPLKHGTHRYAASAEVMLLTYAFDDGPVQCIEFPARGDLEDLLEQAEFSVWHNSYFDRTVIAKSLGVEMDPRRIFDTMACALSHSLPGSLGTLCDVLSVASDKAKDKAGKELINLFCKPRPKTQKVRRYTKHTHPVEWERFVSYAKSDILAMRELYRKLPRWNYDIGKTEHELWRLDQSINDRGIRVDTGLAAAAVAAVKDEKERLAVRTRELTRDEVERATQRDKLLKHLLSEYGIDLPDLQKGTLERRIQDPDIPEPVRELLAIRLSASSTSTSKYQALLDGVSDDGRLRGTLQFCGAARTGRWSGRLFQPQNLPRPDEKRMARELGLMKLGEDDDLLYYRYAVEAIKAGIVDMAFADPIGVCQDLVRGCLIAPEGKKLVVADLANIEGRVLAWLADEAWKLDAFRAYDAGEGPDLYKVTAGRILRKPPSEVTKDERQSSGKVSELACGFQGAVGAFSSMAKLYGLDLEEDEVIRIVKEWRKAHPATVKLWYALEDAAREVVAVGGVREVGMLKLRRQGAWLQMRLPSGRLLCYPSPRIEPVKTPCKKCEGDGVVIPEGMVIETFLKSESAHAEKCAKCNGRGWMLKDQLTYMGVNQYTRRWERIKTYGGKLVENATQATARDVIAAGMIAADRAGFDVLLSVHDELITEADEDDPLLTADDLVRCMTTQIPWTAGLPLAAEGEELRRYRK